MQLAHSLTPGGPDIEVMLIAIALLGLGIALFMQKSAKPYVPVVLLVLALVVGAGSFAIGRDSGAQATGTVEAPDGLAVEIVQPADRSQVPADRPLDVVAEVAGGELTSDTESDDPRLGHLHVFVDDQLISMPSTNTQEVELESGNHTIVVEFTTADHRSYEPRVIDEIEVTAR